MDPENMRLLVFTRDFDYFSAAMLADLRSAGVQVTAVAEPQSSSGRWDWAFSEVVQVPLPSRFSAVARDRYAQLMRSTQADVCLCFTSRALHVALRARKKSKLSIPIVATRGAVGGVTAWRLESWLTYLSPSLDAVVGFSHAISRTLQREACRLVPNHPGRFVTIYQGYERLLATATVRPALSASQPQATAIGQVPMAVAMPAPGLVQLVCIANDRPIKGLAFLLNALSKHVTALDWELRIIGRVGDALHAQVQNTPNLRQRVQLMGFRPDARSLLAQGDVYVQPTLFPGEGIGNGIAEAIAAGLPVVVSDQGGGCELVVAEYTGLLFRSDDAADLGRVLDRIIRDADLRSKLTGQGAAWLEQHFSTAAEVAAYKALFASLR